ncbi:MAG: hypothetical protein HOB72_12185 [Rhodospirillaceae bacterium]|jgi:hypothetical protein|nr:hypothetical protein [Rhodospirillaceae bacterium]
MFRPLIAVTALTAGLIFTSFAQAQQVPAGAVCGERAKFLTHLGKNHKEAPTAMGVTASGRVLEVLTSSDGTWTILMTHPNGITCMVTAGQAWENIERVAMGPIT